MGLKASKSTPSSVEGHSNGSNSDTKSTVGQMLNDKSDEVNAGRENYVRGKILAHKILLVLQNRHKDVDRVTIIRNTGKRTAVGKVANFEVVIFLNNKRPPFVSALTEIKKTLSDSKQLADYKFLKISTISISFEISGFKFDLFPATNFKDDSDKESQQTGTLEAVELLADPMAMSYLYSPGFAESHVEFLRSKSEFTHQVIRLAKHWDNNVHAGCRIRGRSFIIELIAIKSCEDVDDNEIYLAFKRFLENIYNFPNLVIFFEYLYKKEQIPKEIFDYQGAIIVDPVNYCHNLTTEDAFPTSAVLNFILAAEVSLNRLDYWIKYPKSDAKAINEIFEPDS